MPQMVTQRTAQIKQISKYCLGGTFWRRATLIPSRQFQLLAGPLPSSLLQSPGHPASPESASHRCLHRALTTNSSKPVPLSLLKLPREQTYRKQEWNWSQKILHFFLENTAPFSRRRSLSMEDNTDFWPFFSDTFIVFLLTQSTGLVHELIRMCAYRATNAKKTEWIIKNTVNL